MTCVALFLIAMAGILTMWAPSRWALSAFQVLILGVAAARVAGRLRSCRRIVLDPAATALGFVGLWGAAQLLAGWTVNPFRTGEEIVHWAVVLSAFAVILEDAKDARLRRNLLTITVVFGTLLSILATITVFVSPPGVIAGIWDVGTKAATLGPFVYRNQWAAFVEAILPVALLRALTDRERPWLYAIAAGLLFASVIAAGSRTGAVLLIAELVLIPVICAVRGIVPVRRLVRIGAGIVVSVAGLTLAVGWQFLWSRFQEPNPFGLRWDLLQSSLEMFRARPWTGWGLGTWPDVYPGFARYDDGSYVNQAHGDWGQWAAEGGFPVLAALVWMFLRTLQCAFRNAWSWGMIAVFIHAAVDYPFQQRPQLAIFFFVMLAIAQRDKSQG